MLFNSYPFLLVFLPVTLAGYFLLRRFRNGAALSLWFLVLASLFYYAWWNPSYIFLILASITVNYYLGQSLSTLASTRSRRLLLGLGITVNLGALAYFKYTTFALRSVSSWFHLDWTPPEILLPIGISFFTFQQIAFLVDAHRGLTREYRFRDYCLFVTFFPQLIAGPIVHHGEMMPQFERNSVRSSDFAVGAVLFILGLAKKVLIADACAPLSTAVFDRAAAGDLVTTTEAWSAALAYSMQLYFDFSGYSDMAIGLARCFGIRLPVNFNSPYQARNIVDFWRRWHMTLSRFLRDYLYIPLGGNRYGPSRRYANLLLTMLLGGIWHGAGWTFAVWGLLHGLYLCINHAWQRLASHLPFLNHRLLALPYRGITFLAVLVAWVYFRAIDVPSAHRMLHAMSGLSGATLAPVTAVADWGAYLSAHLPVAFAMMVAFLLPNSQTWLARYRPVLERTEPHPQLRLRLSFTIAAALGVVFTACLLGMNQLSEFLYYQF